VIGVQPFYQLVATGTILGVSLDQFRSHRQETR
jgi:predicted ABC-type sugar transport system permease subunit